MADKTFKTRAYWTTSRAGTGGATIYSGPGTSNVSGGAPGLDSGPSFLEAVTR